MAILASQIIWRYPAVRSDAGGNGGRMTATSIPDTKNSVFPDVTQDERAAGSIKYRKVHIHIANIDDLTYLNSRLFVETYTPGADSVTMFLGTYIDTQSGLTGSERQFGAGQLNTTVSAGATSIDVMTEAAALGIFQNGDLIRVSDKDDVNDVTGNSQFVAISGAVSYAGDVATLPLAAALDFNFNASATRVASVIEVGDVIGAFENFVVTSSAGTYDEVTNPVEINSVGGIYQNWTLSFTSATAFNVIGDTLGTIGTGNITSATQPTNIDFGVPYFILQYQGFGGTFTSGDTITFRTLPAAIPVWYKRTIPAGIASLSNNNFIVGIIGESA